MSSLTRRDFLRVSAVATAGLATQWSPGYAAAYAGQAETIRVGLIGCGGRGTGAARDCVTSSEGVELVAMGDLFPDRLERSKNQLTRAIGDKFKVTGETSFVGFDAYKQVLATDVDLVILATPPGFRPLHLRAAIDAGKHVFTEKPVAVDPVGVRSVFETSDLAKSKNLAIVAGTQRRHDPKYRETIQRIHDGAIGDIVAGNVYWNQGGLWTAERKPEMSDTEWQIRNWLYFTWLSGDHVVEQHVHNIDVANWVLGGHPIRANGVGGRQVRTGPEYGHIYDHFCVEFEYPNGARITSMCRQQDGTAGYVGEFFIGTRGTSNAADTIRGATAWKYSGEEVNPYQQEHADLIASIRAGQPLNEGRQVAESVLTAIMAREAAYTGQDLTWDQVLNANLKLVPDQVAFGDLPMAPVAMPGVTKLERPMYGHSHEATSQAG
ncbi:MAG TPA: Gfo/Idh/MocA family oxidoreductase [Longimicrobiaceae bacterium]